MNDNLSENLDSALTQLQEGWSLQAVLADYPDQAEELRPLLTAAHSLRLLPTIPLPPAEIQILDRNRFLNQIGELQAQAVPPDRLTRLKGWMAAFGSRMAVQTTQDGKEKGRMSTIVVTITLIIALLVGSVGSTASWAAASLPGSPAYGIKLLLEQVQSAQVSDPADEARLQLSFAQERLQEVHRLANAGEPIDEPLQLRLQNHLQAMLRLSAETPDEARIQLLEQARVMVQEQERALQQTGAEAATGNREQLRKVERIMAQFGQDVDEGLEHPYIFRWRHGQDHSPGAPVQPEVVPPGRGNRQQNGVPPDEPLQEREQERTRDQQEQNGEPASEPSQEREQERTRDQQEQSGEPASEPNQEREQEQERARNQQEQNGEPVSEPDQEREQEQERARNQQEQNGEPVSEPDQEREQEQERNQEQVRNEDPAPEPAQEQEQEREQEQEQSSPSPQDPNQEQEQQQESSSNTSNSGQGGSSSSGSSSGTSGGGGGKGNR